MTGKSCSGLLSACLFVSQAITCTSAMAAQAAKTADSAGRHLDVSFARSDSPVITIAGLCDNSSQSDRSDFSCKIVIDQKQFEQMIEAIQPGMPPRERREFALRYADALLMARRAEAMGLGKGTNYDEQMKLARIQVLSQDLKKVIEERASQVSAKDIEDYYRENSRSFDKATLERISIPKRARLQSVSATNQNSENSVGEEANSLHVRAMAGEDFRKLQADAYFAAGIASAVPSTIIDVRRTSLSPDQSAVIDLQPGEISSIFADANGYVIYKMRSKEKISLEHARPEIKTILRTQRIQNATHAILDSTNVILDEAYFPH